MQESKIQCAATEGLLIYYALPFMPCHKNTKNEVKCILRNKNEILFLTFNTYNSILSETAWWRRWMLFQYLYCLTQCSDFSWHRACNFLFLINSSDIIFLFYSKLFGPSKYYTVGTDLRRLAKHLQRKLILKVEFFQTIVQTNTPTGGSSLSPFYQSLAQSKQKQRI